jgi:two-component system CheB/CheR fusion protein
LSKDKPSDDHAENNGHNHPNPELVTESDYSPPRGNAFPIVGIGASAGGLEAFAQLLSAIPGNTGIAFVLVQHLDPQHESLLTELLTRAARIPIETVHDGAAVQPDHIYVIPPNTTMELQDGHLRLVAREPGLHLPIDIFFRSLAKIQGSRAIGVVLSGNASDGSLGVRAIKAECGLTFAQDESTARFSGMPRNAIATGAVDFILPPADIGRELARLGNHRFLIASEPGIAESETLPEGDGDLKRILALLQASTKVDFSHYKPTTIQRRVGRRMMVLHIESLAEYVRYIQKRPSELAELYKDLLISVTSFFRDPAAFDAILRHLAAALRKREEQDAAIRVWVPGCATGEEVYSLAICLHEFLQDHHQSLPIQLFGTDISDIALQRARQGLYGAAISDDVSENRLHRFFTRIDGGYQINKLIRECCVFARHDVTKDPPFSRLDLVSCRNVLIYLDLHAQRRVLPTFHYALNPTGLLMLGSAETTGAASDLFIVLDKPHHIFARKSGPSRLLLDRSSTALSTSLAPAGRSELPAPSELQKKLERLIQTKYAPDAVVVDAEMQILQFRGRTAPYLDPTPGEASLNLLRMARENLVLPLRRAIQKAAESDTTVREVVPEGDIDCRSPVIWFEVTPLLSAEAADRFFLIVFGRNEAQTLSLEAPEVSQLLTDDDQTAALKRELTETRDYLRSLTEQYEAHAEELKAANEEARSANEELQSTNEELGTTKEELQSANEELTTVNEELQNRNQELAATNSDLRNLLSAVTLPIVMVDQDLRVRRFNATAEKLLELSAIDLGRPVGHLRGRIETPQLEKQVRRVIETLSPIVDETQDVEGRWYSIAVRPYRTLDDRIAGAIITYQDIDTLKRGLEASEGARQYAEALIETVRQPLVVLDADLRVRRATSTYYDTFLVARDETEGRFLYDIGNGQWNRARLRELIGSALFRSEPFHDFEVEHDFPHIGRRTMRLSAQRIPQRNPQDRTVLLAIEDVTERREVAEIRFQRLFETAKDGIVVIDAEAQTVKDVNAFFLGLTGFQRHDFLGKTLGEVGALLGMAGAAQILQDTQTSEVVRLDDRKIITSSGEVLPVDIVANRYLVGTHPVVQLNIRDVSPRRKAARELHESEERFRLVVESVRDYAIFQLNEDGDIVTWNNGAERLLGWSEQEAIGRNASLIFTPEDIERGEHRRELELARLEGRAQEERWHLRKDGSRFFASGVLTCVNRDDGSGMVCTKVMQDITTRQQQDERLRQSLDEKSILVREIHHRVKNNLQMIVSLLNLQANHTEDADLLSAFEEAKGRVRAIAQIHEQLHVSEDLSEVEVGAYLEVLANELVALHTTVPDGVELHLAAQELTLPIEKAIPVGLIANELILNSLKHGLRAGTGSLSITLEHVAGEPAREDTPSPTAGRARLRVHDSGAGFPEGFDPAKAASMGYQLVNLLVRQVRGRMEIANDAGASVIVTFPLPAGTPAKEEQISEESDPDRRR